MELMLFTILITLHVIADFYFQTDKIAKAKIISYEGVYRHAIQYAFTFAIALVCFRTNIKLILFLCLAVLAHFLIDSLKFIVNKGRFFDRVTDKLGMIFVLDQLLHILSMFLIVLLASGSNIKISLFPLWTRMLQMAHIDPVFIIRWILVILLIMKPANIVFRLLFSSFKPEDEDINGIEEKNKRAGAIIGCLERILIVIFISVKQ
ncbi:MAG: DUF3307 domain-containing protein, partial [Ruminiclostridium sp.]